MLVIKIQILTHSKYFVNLLKFKTIQCIKYLQNNQSLFHCYDLNNNLWNEYTIFFGKNLFESEFPDNNLSLVKSQNLYLLNILFFNKTNYSKLNSWQLFGPSASWSSLF